MKDDKILYLKDFCKDGFDSNFKHKSYVFSKEYYEEIKNNKFIVFKYDGIYARQLYQQYRKMNAKLKKIGTISIRVDLNDKIHFGYLKLNLKKYKLEMII